MARTSKSRGKIPFSMKSGNGTTFKMMGSSPIRGGKEDKAKYKTYTETRASVTADMTDEQLRDMTVAQHGGEANKWNVSVNELKALRNAKLKAAETEEKPETVQEVDTEDKDLVQVSALSETDLDRITKKYGLGPDPTGQRSKEIAEARENFEEGGEFSWYGQSGTTDPRLTRDETYADYAYSIDKDKHPEGLLKPSAVDKKSPLYKRKAKASRGYNKKLATKIKEAKIDIVGKRKPGHFLTRKKTVPMEGYIAPINTPKGMKRK